MTRPVLPTHEALDFQLGCRVLTEQERPDGVGFYLETAGLTPPLTIVQLMGNTLLGAWEVKARTVCCFSTLRMEQRGKMYFEVCRECGVGPKFRSTCSLMVGEALQDWVPQLLPSHWDLLQRELYLPSLNTLLHRLIAAGEEAVEPLEKAIQQPHRIYFNEMYRRYESSIREILEVEATSVNGTIL